MLPQPLCTLGQRHS
ncbi:hypothetical protein Nmel_008172 [Mimus melanotis]